MLIQSYKDLHVNSKTSWIYAGLYYTCRSLYDGLASSQLQPMTSHLHGQPAECGQWAQVTGSISVTDSDDTAHGI